MQGVRIDSEDPVDRRATLRTINEVADELYFFLDLEPGDGVVGLVPGTAVNAIKNPQTVLGTPTIEFPATAGGKPAWRINVRRKRRWQRAGLRLRVSHTGGAGAGNVRLEMILRSWSAGDLFPGRVDLATGWTFAESAAGTAALLEYVTTATTVVPGDKEWMTLFFYRDKTNAADTCVGSLFVPGITLEVLPQ